jgi:EmrB/QacA subfamily drug resistance transporter
MDDARRWQALTVCLVAGFMALLDTSIVNVALPAIRAGLHASVSDLQWIVSGYALAFGLVLVPAGRFGDARGRRNAFVLGVAVFTLASAAAGLAPGAGYLVAARLVQGFGAGVLNPQVSGLIQQLFQGSERARAFGMLGTTIGISTAVGPLLGGLLIHLAGEREGWRWVFYVNLPIGALAILLAYRLIPPYVGRSDRRESLDLVGVLLLGTGVFLILLPLVEEQQWHGRGKWLLSAAGLVVLAGFTAWERWYSRRREPVVDLAMFRRRSFALGAVIALIYFAGFAAIFFVFTLYLQNGLHYSALQAGLAISPFALGSAAAAALGGRIVDRFGRYLVAVGLALVAVGVAASVLAVELVPGPGAGWAAAVPLLVAGIGSGLVIAPNITLTLAEVPVREAGSAGGVVQTGQRIGAACGIAAVASVFFATVASSNDWAQAYRHALLVTLALILVSLGAAIADVLVGRARYTKRTPERRAARE